jgi:DNA-binding response OmpR family regulator
MRILFIEDDPKLSSSISKHLRAESFAVDIADDGKKGEEFAHVNEYDVILLDIMLPHQDGWTTCRNLRQATYSHLFLCSPQWMIWMIRFAD